MARLRRVVHIGTKEYIPGKNVKIKTGELHIVFEPNPEVRAELKEAAAGNRFLKFFPSSGTRTGLRDASVQEVHMNNVLNDTGMDRSRQLGLLREAGRIIEPGQPIFLAHTYDPPPQRLPKEQLVILARDAGLHMEVLFENHGEPTAFPAPEVRDVFLRTIRYVPAIMGKSYLVRLTKR